MVRSGLDGALRDRLERPRWPWLQEALQVARWPPGSLGFVARSRGGGSKVSLGGGRPNAPQLESVPWRRRRLSATGSIRHGAFARTMMSEAFPFVVAVISIVPWARRKTALTLSAFANKCCRVLAA